MLVVALAVMVRHLMSLHLVPRCGVWCGCCEGSLVGVGTRVAGSAALSLVTGATPLRPEPALFEAMLAGWRCQQQSRRLSESMIGCRERTVRRFAGFTGGWPWCWSPAQLESWTASGGWAHSTVRSYQGALGCFLDYVCDPRYGWVSECESRWAPGRGRSCMRVTVRCMSRTTRAAQRDGR